MKDTLPLSVFNTVITSFALFFGTLSALVFPTAFLSQGAVQGAVLQERPSVAIVSPIREDAWERFLDEKYKLLTKEIVLQLPEEIRALRPNGWNIRLADHQEWILVQQTKTGIIAGLDRKILEQYLAQEVLPLLPQPSHALITALPDPESEDPHAAYDGIARDGWILRPDAATIIMHNVEHGVLAMDVPVAFVRGTVHGVEGTGIGNLSLLARGRSNFGNSVPNRIFNIEKAINEHVQGAYVPQNGIFSFNDLLGGKVTTTNGWRLALGIFRSNGEEGVGNVEGTGLRLTPTPGGGICQTSTTAFRAIAAAGLPVLERFNHSMYVNYYRDFGEGLDATIYPGSRNMKATNDTPGPLYFQAYMDGKDVYVEIFGTPDRTVALEGPYRNHDNNEKIKELLKRNLGTREIGWVQTVTRDDGTVTQDIIKSYYQTEIPWKTAEKAGELPVVVREQSPQAVVDIVQEEEKETVYAATKQRGMTARSIRAMLLRR